MKRTGDVENMAGEGGCQQQQQLEEEELQQQRQQKQRQQTTMVMLEARTLSEADLARQRKLRTMQGVRLRSGPGRRQAERRGGGNGAQQMARQRWLLKVTCPIRRRGNSLSVAEVEEANLINKGRISPLQVASK